MILPCLLRWRQGRKAIHDRLARLVIVNCELRDRLPATVPAGLQVLLDDVQAWLGDEDAARNSTADALIARSEQLAEPLRCTGPDDGRQRYRPVLSVI